MDWQPTFLMRLINLKLLLVVQTRPIFLIFENVIETCLLRVCSLTNLIYSRILSILNTPIFYEIVSPVKIPIV